MSRRRISPAPGAWCSIDGFSVAVLVCGELFNRRARAAIGALRPRLVVDTGHKSMGQGLIPAMRSVARTAGCPVAHAHHLAGYETQQIHFVNVQGGRESVPANAHLERSGGLWASWAPRIVASVLATAAPTPRCPPGAALEQIAAPSLNSRERTCNITAMPPMRCYQIVTKPN